MKKPNLLAIDGDLVVDIFIDNNGYVRLRKTNEYLHRVIVERVLGRKLTTKERVHHVDGDKANNHNCNLVVCQDDKYHQLLHARQRIVELGGVPNQHKYCRYHDKLHKVDKFSTSPKMYDGLHNICRDACNEYRRLKGLSRGKFNWRARMNQQFRREINKGKNNLCLI